MKILKHKRNGNVRKTYFLGIPIATRIRVVYARGGIEYVRYIYKIFNLTVKRTHMQFLKAKIGANDGLEIDNTLLFENLGWQGFCVEANPKTFEKLKHNRKCDCYNVALFSENVGKIKMATSNISGFDTLEMNADEAYKNKIKAWTGEELEYIEVETTTFNALMQNYSQVSHIDFMSLDV